jgi:hypothetical protein
MSSSSTGAGIGSRGFAVAYLEKRHSPDTPVRAHSFELDALSELGIVGFGLVLAALVPLLVPIVAGTLARDAAATAAFGGAAYWLVHASVDWLWTVPACGLPFFLLLGLGGRAANARPWAAGRRSRSRRRGRRRAARFVPPWLSARLTVRGQTAWAKRLDPLAVEPYVAQAARSPTPQGAIDQLRSAVRKEPRVVELRFALASAYRRAGEKRGGARGALQAQRLDPESRGSTRPCAPSASGGALYALGRVAPSPRHRRGGLHRLAPLELLLADGWEVFALDDVSTGSLENVAHLRERPDYHLVVDSVLSPRVVNELVHKCDVVFHLAAPSGVRLIVSSPCHTMVTNVQGTETCSILRPLREARR